MDAVVNSSSTLLADLVIKMARLFKLIGARTTILTYSEELQLFQYCYALHNQKMSGLYNANKSESAELHLQIIEEKTEGLKREIEMMYSKESDIRERSLDDQTVSGEGCHDDKDKSTPLEKEEGKSDKGNNQIERLESPTLLFTQTLRSSNHCTLIQVFDKFLKEILKQESALHAFVKSNFKGNVTPGSCFPLIAVETLALDVMKRISGAGDENSEPNSFTSQLTKPSKDTESSFKDQRVFMSPTVSRTQRLKDDATSKTPKTPIGALRTRHFLCSPLPATPITPSTDLERAELQKKFIENIFRSYLHLLVNSRCELALAFVFNIPARELTHQAFTHLKHASLTSRLSMFQTLSSMLMRIRLGGNGYAPPQDSPLLAYMKGLGSLFDFVDKLQTIIEESPSPRSACKRVVNILKRAVGTCKSNKFPLSVVDGVANALWDILDDILSSMEKGQKDAGGSGSQQDAGEGGSVYGQLSIKALCSYLDLSATRTSDVDHFLLGDVRFTQDTPTRFPCLVSQFRSPQQVMDSDLKEDEQDVTSDTTGGFSMDNMFSTSEALYLAQEKDDIVCTPRDFSDIYIIPSKTIVHPKCGADYGQTSVSSLFSPEKVKDKLATDSKPQRVGCARKRRRPNKKGQLELEEVEVMRDMTNTSQDSSKIGGRFEMVANTSVGAKPQRKIGKETLQVNSKKEKSCRRKLMPQIKGQSTLFGFFKS